MTVSDRMNDMLERYGEVCPQIKAAQILSVSPRTIMRMADDGRLRRVGSHIDVRSICHYIENDQGMNFRARYRKRYPVLRNDSTLLRLCLSHHNPSNWVYETSPSRDGAFPYLFF